MVCPYCKSPISQEDIFCPSCDSQLYAPKDFLTMASFSPLNSILRWIELYRSGSYSLGKFQTRVRWLMEAVQLQKEQIEGAVSREHLTESVIQTRKSFIQILGLMLDALTKTDQHLREGEEELLMKSLETIHEVHNKLHDLKKTMEETFSREELQPE